MTRRSLSLWLDAVMLLVFAALLSWRLTGVPIHEWAATALLVVLVVHLVIHWRWVETRIAMLRTGPRRTRVNVLLNLTLFIAMGAALVSGFVISKVMFPNTLTPSDYLRWHGLHDGASMLAMVAVGLHLALNWDLVAGGLRRAARRIRGSSRTFVPAPRSGLEWRAVPGRLALITLAALVLTAGTFAFAGLMPGNGKVLLVMNGHSQLVDPPKAITRMDGPGRKPDPARGSARLVVQLALLGAVGATGRRLLKLKL